MVARSIHREDWSRSATSLYAGVYSERRISMGMKLALLLFFTFLLLIIYPHGAFADAQENSGVSQEPSAVEALAVENETNAISASNQDMIARDIASSDARTVVYTEQLSGEDPGSSGKTPDSSKVLTGDTPGSAQNSLDRDSVLKSTESSLYSNIDSDGLSNSIDSSANSQLADMQAIESNVLNNSDLIDRSLYISNQDDRSLYISNQDDNASQLNTGDSNPVEGIASSGAGNALTPKDIEEVLINNDQDTLTNTVDDVSNHSPPGQSDVATDTGSQGAIHDIPDDEGSGVDPGGVGKLPDSTDVLEGDIPDSTENSPSEEGSTQISAEPSIFYGEDSNKLADTLTSASNAAALTSADVNLSPQATVTITFSFYTSPTSKTDSTIIYYGYADDPIFDSGGSYVGVANTTSVTFSATAGAQATVPLYQRYGYSYKNAILEFDTATSHKVYEINLNAAATGLTIPATYLKTTYSNYKISPLWKATPITASYMAFDNDYVQNSSGEKIQDSPLYWDSVIRYPETVNNAVYSASSMAEYTSGVDIDWYIGSDRTKAINPDGGVTYRDMAKALYSLTPTFTSSYYGSFSLYPKAKAGITYKVTYNPGTGATGSATTIEYTSKSALATSDGTSSGTKPEASFSKSGYTFAGWAFSASATSGVIGSAGSLSTVNGGNEPADQGNYTLYAVWTPKTYTVNWNVNGGTAISPSSKTTNFDGSGLLPTSNPTRTGYSFGGWKTSSGTSVSSTTLYSALVANDTVTSVTLVAQWTEKTGYKVNFYAYDGTSLQLKQGPGSYNWTGTVVTPSNPSREGYSFGGWYTDVASNNGSGTKLASSSYQYSNLWNVAHAANTSIADGDVLNFYANWVKENDVSVTYALAGGTNGPTSPQSVAYNGNHTVSTTTPERTGYTFGGWLYNSTTYTGGAVISNITSNITLTAQWTADAVTITYMPNNGTLISGQSDTQNTTTGTATTLKGTIFQRAGYTLQKWNTKADGSGTDYSLSGSFTPSSTNGVAYNDSTHTGAISLYAVWKAIDYIVNWNANGGTLTTTASSKTTQFDGTGLLPSSNPTRSGYTFASWNTQANGSGTTVTASTAYNTLVSNNASTTSATIYAIWTENKVTIKFVADDHSKLTGPDGVTSSNGATVTYTIGEATGTIYNGSTATSHSITSGITPSFDSGYEFDQWSKVSAGGTAFTSGVATNGKLTPPQTSGLYVNNTTYYLTSKPKEIAYRVEVYLEGLDSSTGLGNNIYTLSSANSYGGDGSKKAKFGYTVMFGSGSADKTVYLTTPTITGYEFNSEHGSNVVSDAIGELSSGATVANQTDNLLKLYFKRATFTVESAWTGSPPDGYTYSNTRTYAYGATVSLPDVTAINSAGVPSTHTYGGWSAASDNPTSVSISNPNSGASFTMPAGNVKVKAEWTKKKYTVTFQNGSSTSIGTIAPSTKTVNVYYNEYVQSGDIPVVTVVNPTDYYFLGWQPSVGGTTGSYVSSSDIATNYPIVANTTFTAYFGKKIIVSYVQGDHGTFSAVDGQITSTTTGGITYTYATNGNDGTVYRGLTPYRDATNQQALPTYGGAVDDSSSNLRNAGNPTGTDGYKFNGWTWKTADGNTHTAIGKYVSGVFTKTSGDDMPTTVDETYEFKALWVATTQDVIFSASNFDGSLTGTPAPSNTTATTGSSVTLPTISLAGYTLSGWTTNGSDTWSGTYTMGPGTRDESKYSSTNDYYGVTLYPVFTENRVTITYAFATGSTSAMGGLTPTSEPNLLAATGTATGSTATANDGYYLKGWYTDAAHTNQITDTAWITNTVTGTDGYVDSITLVPQKVGGAYSTVTYYAWFMPIPYDITFVAGDHGTFTIGSTTNATTTTKNAIDYNTALSTIVPTVAGNDGVTVVPDNGYTLKGWVRSSDGQQFTDVSALKVLGEETYTAVYEERSGFTVHYNVNSGTPAIADASVKWTDKLYPAQTLTRRGYDFGGWWMETAFTNEVVTGENGTTFADVVSTLNLTSYNEITIYAKWTPKTGYTVNYDLSYPSDAGVTEPSIPSKTNVSWEDTNLLPSGYNPPTLAGYRFDGWWTDENGTGTKAENSTAFSTLYAAVYTTGDDPEDHPVTLYAAWTLEHYTVNYVNSINGATVKSVSLTWNDLVDYYDYDFPGYTLTNWQYTPGGSGTQNFNSGDTLHVYDLAGTNDPDDGDTLTLTAVMVKNATYKVEYYLVDYATNDLNSRKSPVLTPGTSTTLPYEGDLTVGQAADVTNLGDNYDYTTSAFFSKKGYRYDSTYAGTVSSVVGDDVTTSATIVFKLYWVEQPYTVTYSLGAGADAEGLSAADKTVGWNFTDLEPSTPLTRAGYEPPTWQYLDGSNNLVDLGSSDDFAKIALNDDTAGKTVMLYAVWTKSQVTLTYKATAGGKITGGSFNIIGAGSDSETINAIDGTPTTVTAEATSDAYKFTGWYDAAGNLISEDQTFTATKSGDVFVTATYEARFAESNTVTYYVYYWLEDIAGGTYTKNTSATKSYNVYEGIDINLDPADKKSFTGFTYAIVADTNTSISQVENGDSMNLYYTRNQYSVDVVSGSGSDIPASMPTIQYPSTGITGAHTNQPYGATLTIPTMPSVSGWSFEWTVTYTDDETNTLTTLGTYNNGDTFTVPNGPVTITGTWQRETHDVTFEVLSTNNHGTVTGGPFHVMHGHYMSDGSPYSDGDYSMVSVVANNGYVFLNWKIYIKDTPTSSWTDTGETTEDPDSVQINHTTRFVANWAISYYLSYSPGSGTGNHGGTDFTSAVTYNQKPVNTLLTDIPLMINGVDKTSNPPAADGYSFIGWTWTKNGTTYYKKYNEPTHITLVGTSSDLPEKLDSNLTLTAIWEAQAFTITYLQGEGTWTDPTADHTVDAYTGTNVSPLLNGNDIEREFYTLGGWQVYDPDTGIVDTSVTYTTSFPMPGHDVTLVPVWEYNGAVIKYVAALKDGYTQFGTYTFGSVSRAQETVNEGATTVNGSTATAHDGYEFIGWYTSTDGASSHFVQVGDTLQPTLPDGGAWANVTYYALFVPVGANYNIEYRMQQSDGTYTSMTQTFSDVESGELADLSDSTNPAYTHLLVTSGTGTGTYPGYVLATPHDGELLSATVNPAGTTTLIVYYDLLYYRVHYADALEGTGAAAVLPTERNDYLWTSSVSMPATPTKAGYTFYQWTTDQGGSNAYSPQTYGAFATAMGFDSTVTADADTVPTLYAQWKKNVDFKVYAVRELEDGTFENIVTNWTDNTFTSYDGQVISVTGNSGGLVTVTGDHAQGIEYPTLTVPTVPGYEVTGVSYDGDETATHVVMVPGEEPIINLIFTAKTGYTVNYLDKDGNVLVSPKTPVKWDEDHLAAGSVTPPAGYKLDTTTGNGWAYKTADGTYVPITEDTNYANLVYGTTGGYDDTIMSRDLYALWLPRSYTVVYYDDTAVDSMVEILTDNDLAWGDYVDLSDPDTLAGYTKDYKWIGWETRRTVNGTEEKETWTSATYSQLAQWLGMTDVDDNEAGKVVEIYAVWAKYVPYIVQFIKVDADGTETDLGSTAPPASEKVAYVGSTVTAGADEVEANRPAGYRSPSPLPSAVMHDPADGTDNIIVVKYTQITNYKLILDANDGVTGTVQTIDGLKWTSKPYSQATVAPTRRGYTLKTDVPATGSFVRWNTKEDGTGLSFASGTSYDQIAAAIFGSEIDDLAIAEDGLTLYAQWTVLADHRVIYDVNNDKNVNTNVLTDVETPDEVQVPADKENVAWTDDNLLADGDAMKANPLGYHFDSWNTAIDGSGLKVTDATTYEEISDYLSKDVELKKVTLYAQWAEDVVEITYAVKTGDGSVSRTVDKITAVTGTPVGTDDGSRFTSTAVAARGWHFVKWELAGSDENNLSAMALTNGVSGENIVTSLETDELLTLQAGEDGIYHSALYLASFEENDPATLIYDVNGGTGYIDPVTAPYDSYIVLSDGSPYSRPYYTLVGWNTKPDGSGTAYEFGQTNYEMPEGGATLYAQWKVNSYPVTVVSEDGGDGTIVGGTEDVEYLGSPSAPFVAGVTINPGTGKIFGGWTYTMTDAETGVVTTGTITNIDDIVVTGPVTIKAIWKDDPNYVAPGTNTTNPSTDSNEPASSDSREGSPVPATGDSSQTLMLLFMILACALAILLIARTRRHEDDDEAALASETAHEGVACADMRALLVVALAGTVIACTFLLASAPRTAWASEDAETPVQALEVAEADTNATADVTGVNGAENVSQTVVAAAGAGIVDEGQNVHAANAQEQADDDELNGKTGEAAKGTETDKKLSAAEASDTIDSANVIIDDGPYFFGYTPETDITLAATDDNEVVVVYGYVADDSNQWAVKKVTEDTTAESLYTISNKGRYLVRDGNGGVTLSSALTNNAYWRFVSDPQIDGLSGYFIDNDYGGALGLMIGSSGSSTKVVCNTQHHVTWSSDDAAPGELWSWTLTSVIALDWDILYSANASNVSGSTEPTHVLADETTKIASNGFKRPGYDFTGWNTKADGTGNSYAAGSLVDMVVNTKNFTLVLYAQWKERVATLSYSVEGAGSVSLGGTGTNKSEVSESIGSASGVIVGTSTRKPSGAKAVADTGYHFTGWTVSSTDSKGNSLTLDESQKSSPTLSGAAAASTALWADSADESSYYHPTQFEAGFDENSYTLSYSANGAEGDEDSSISLGYTGSAVLSAASTLSKDGYSFSSWNTAADGSGVSLSAASVVDSNVIRSLISSGALQDADGASTTLYAQWSENPAPIVDPEENSSHDDPAPIVAPADDSYVEPDTPSRGQTEYNNVVDAISNAATETTQVIGEPLVVAPVSATPIVTVEASASGLAAADSSNPGEFFESFANMSTAEKAQTATAAVGAVAAVGVIASLLGAGASLAGAVAAASAAGAGAAAVGAATAAGASGAADIVAELYAEGLVAGGILKGRKRKKGGQGGDQDGEQDGEGDGDQEADQVDEPSVEKAEE